MSSAFHTTMFYGNYPERFHSYQTISPFHTTMFYGNLEGIARYPLKDISFPHNYVLRKPEGRGTYTAGGGLLSTQLCSTETVIVHHSFIFGVELSTQLCSTETTDNKPSISELLHTFHTTMFYGNEYIALNEKLKKLFPHNYVLRKQKPQASTHSTLCPFHTTMFYGNTWPGYR